MRPLIRSLFLFIPILLLSMVVQAQDKQIALPEGVTRGPSVEGITEYRLANGLRVLLFPDPSKPTITVNITYLVGSRHEGYGETGMAHLLEHMVFKGSTRHPNIPQELTEHGARPNGTTWYDRTNYFETFNATEENLRWALDLEADRMVNSFIRAEDLESEMTVVRNEYEAGENSPTSVLMKRTLAAAFQWHNYGKSTIGERSDIENVPIERLRAFYRKYYQPDNAVLLVAGKIDEQHTLELVNEYFGKIPKPDRVLYPTYTREPVQDGERLVTLKRVGDIQAVSCVYKVCPGSHPDYAAVAVLTQLLTTQPSGRLYEALVKTKKASNVWGFAPALAEPGFVYFNADVRKEDDLEEARRTMLAVFDSLKTNPPTQEEVERAKARLLKNWDLAYKSADRVGLQMSEYIAQGDWRLFFLYRDRVSEVTPEDVARVANYYFKPDNRTVGLFIPVEKPDRVEVPDVPDLTAMLANYTGREGVSMGEAFDPSPDNIEKRTRRGTLDNGIKYAMLPKDTRGDAVNFTMTVRYGNEQSLWGKGTAAEVMSQMLRRGTKKHTRQELEDLLDSLNARVSIYGAAGFIYASIETERKNLQPVVDLVSEMLLEPSFPEDEFETLREQLLADAEESLSDPQALASNAFSRKLSPWPEGHPRATETIEKYIESLKKLTLDDVRSLYEEQVGAGESTTLAVVGDFDEDAIRERLNRHFGHWTSKVRYARIPDKFFPTEHEEIVIETPDKANAIFFAGMNIPMRDDHPDYPALVLGNYMLGGGFLNSRLATRIRQQEGLSYGVGSFFNANALDATATFGAYAIYNPENVDKLLQAFREEIEKVRSEGFTAEEVEAAKAGWLQSQVVSRSQDRTLASKLASYLFIDRTFEWDKQLEARIQALTPEQINEAMRKYIDLDKMIFVRAGDFAKAKNKVDKP